MWGERELVVVPTTHPGGHLGHVMGAPMWRSRKEADAFLCSQVFYDLVGPNWPEPGCGVQAPDLFLGGSTCPPLPLPPGVPTYLAVQAQEDEHHEEQGGPERGEGHHGDGLGVGDKGQARAWRGSREKGLSGVQCLIQLLCSSKMD